MVSQPRGSRRWAGKGGKGNEIEEVAMVGSSGRRERNKALRLKGMQPDRCGPDLPGSRGL